MNNLAVSFAQHPIRPASESPINTIQPAGSGTASTTPQTRADYLESARRWALNANGHATDTAGEARTPECDEACAVALCNLADIAAMMGDNEEAKRRFEEGLEFSKKVGFEPAVGQAQEGLKRLSKT